VVRFVKVGNPASVGDTTVRTSRHLHRGEPAAGQQSEMTSHALDGSNSSWRLSLLRSVMGDSICETGHCLAVVVVLLHLSLQEKAYRLLAWFAGGFLFRMNSPGNRSITFFDSSHSCGCFR